MQRHPVRSAGARTLDRSSQADAAAWCIHFLLQALVEEDGDAAVLHVGERPYLVSPAGAMELADSRLTPAGVESLIEQFLSDAEKGTLHASGMAHADCLVRENLPGERFTVAAARFHDDVRLEIHRLRVPDEDRIPDFPGFGRALPSRDGHDDLTVPSADELWPT